MRRVLIAVALCVLGASAHGQVAQPTPQAGAPQTLTLEDALQRAVKAAPSITRFDHLAAAAAQRVREAQAGMMPSLALQGAATDGPAGAPALGIPGYGLQGFAGDPLKKHYGGGLNVVQPVYDFGRTQFQVASRRALFKAAQEDTSTQEALVLLTVQQAYLNVLRQQQLVLVQEAVVRQRQATVTQAQALVKAGLRADVDLQIAQANLSDSQVALIAARDQVRIAFAALNNAMGETTLTEYTLSPPPAASAPPAEGPTPGAPDALMAAAVQQRPELRRAALQVEAANHSIQAAQSDMLPRLDGFVGVGAIVPSRLINDNKNYAVGLAVTIPLYTGGNVEGRIAEERERREAARAQQRDAEEAVKLQVARAFVNVQTREGQLQAAQAQVNAARAAQQQASERYRLQLNSIEELTTAEAATARAETQYVDAQYDLILARAELDWATGTTYLRYARPARRK